MDKIKNIAKKVLVGLGCLFTIIIVVGIVAPSKETTPVMETPVIETTKIEKVLTKRFSNEFLTNYMDGCMESDSANADYCLCTLYYLEEHYSEEHIIAVSLEIEDGNIPIEIERAAFSCYEELLTQ